MFVSICVFLLQFCATRKGTQQAAATLVKDARFVVNVQHKQRLLQVANSLRDSKLRGLCNMKAPQVSLNIEAEKILKPNFPRFPAATHQSFSLP